MKKVAILTSFTSSDPAYSLNNVVEDQIKMLTQHGYKPVVIVTEGFKPVRSYADKNVTLEFVPRIRRSNQIEVDDNFWDDVDKTYIALKRALRGVDVVLTHDLIYQPSEIKTNIACRRIATETNMRWLHWIHSATTPAILLDELKMKAEGGDIYKRYMGGNFPKGMVVFPNEISRNRIAENFNRRLEEVGVVYHPIDLFSYHGMTDMTRNFAMSYGLLSADVVALYPARLDRGKNLEVVIEIMGGVKRKGLSVRIIMADFHSTGGDKVVYREELKKLAEEEGVGKELIFTSEYDSSLRTECPREMIRDLFLLTNVFIMPSKSESYSLITQEAMACGNVVMTNADFPPFREIFGEFTLHGKFSSNMDAMTMGNGETVTKYSDRRAYMEDMAGLLISEIKLNRVVRGKDKIRKERSLDYVFVNQLQPLIDKEIKERRIDTSDNKTIRQGDKNNLYQEAYLL